MKKLLLVLAIAVPSWGAIACPAPLKPLTSPGFITTSGIPIVAACYDPESGSIVYVNAAYFQTLSLSPAQSGTIRLGANDSICWRNASNTADVCQTNMLTFTAPLVNTGGVITCTIATVLVDGCISAVTMTTFTNSQPTALHSTDTSNGCSGTVYTITAVDTAVACGTTSPTITITAPGTYLLLMTMRYDNAGATYAASRVVTGHLRRTNNTPANVAGSSSDYQTGTVTTVTNTLGFVQTSSVYSTANNDDVISAFVAVNVVPTAGSSTVSGASIRAIRLF